MIVVFKSILRAGALLGTLCWKLILDALKFFRYEICNTIGWEETKHLGPNTPGI